MSLSQYLQHNSPNWACDIELNRNGTSWHQSSFHSTTKQYCMPPLFLLPLLCAIYCKIKAIIALHDFLSSVSHTLPSLFVLALPPIHSNFLLLFLSSVYLVSLKFSRASFLIMCLGYFSWKFSWSFFDSYFLRTFFVTVLWYFQHSLIEPHLSHFNCLHHM